MVSSVSCLLLVSLRLDMSLPPHYTLSDRGDCASWAIIISFGVGERRRARSGARGVPLISRLQTLRGLVGKIPSNPLWAEMLAARQRERALKKTSSSSSLRKAAARQSTGPSGPTGSAAASGASGPMSPTRRPN